MSTAPENFLVIRRDNIGDLVCTLPLIAALRQRFPGARIEALVNSYNRDVLAGHPDLDAVHAYTKGKHRDDESLAGAYWRRLRLLWSLRKRFRDGCVILAAPGEQPRALGYARLIRPRQILGYVSEGGSNPSISMPVPYRPDAQAHEVEKVFALLAPLGIAPPSPPARIAPDSAAVARVRAALAAASLESAPQTQGGPLVALHISARKLSQRWPVESFAELARALCSDDKTRLLVLWAPGGASDSKHPGDDEKAAQLMKAIAGLPALAYPTGQLADLIAALSVCDSAILADGGAMHLAAALGKPILALFGDSDASRWHPWGVPYRLLQAPTREVRDLGVQAVMDAYRDLMRGSDAAESGRN